MNSIWSRDTGLCPGFRRWGFPVAIFPPAARIPTVFLERLTAAAVALAAAACTSVDNDVCKSGSRLVKSFGK